MPLTRAESGTLLLGGLPLRAALTAAGTPSYVYDLDGIAEAARQLDAAFGAAPHLVCFAVKANSAGAVVRTIAGQGCGADVVSGGELILALSCGIEPDRIVYSGVAKRDDEIDRAIACGPAGIGAIQIESVEEIARIEARARFAGRVARVSLRINPSIDLSDATHAHIATGHDEAKFGIPLDAAREAALRACGSPSLKLVGLGVHAGSQFVTLEPYVGAARVLFGFAASLRAAGRCPDLAFVDTGGGFGIDYVGGVSAIAPADFVKAVLREQAGHGLSDLALYVEPGRALVAEHGVLLSRVIQVKVATAARWLMIDAGMNDLMRPALYQARHRIVALDGGAASAPTVVYRVVGPVCESSDDFGEHALPRDVPDAVAILDAGAYGFTMASEYNGRPLPVEVFVRSGGIVARTERGSVERWADQRARAG